MEASSTKAVGNGAKLREAVQSILNLAYEVAAETEEPRCKISNDWLIETCKAALAAPPRNCDVGTAEEQEVRFRNYCWNHSSKDKNMECQCPIDAEGKAGCKLTWAQMPYEEGGAK